MTRGFLLYGVLGTGKTATTNLLARALLCEVDPLGCGKCSSCLMVTKDNFEGFANHSDYKGVDAAEKSGVQDARDLIDIMTGTPNEGKRRVVVIDEAHRLSKEAWDVFLKPLEQGRENDMRTIFIFVSNQPDLIAGTIRSRLTRIPFERLHADTIRGYLAQVAAANNIEYELDALSIIARYSKGVVREAKNILGTVAACGKVTTELTKMILDTSLEDISVKMLLAVARKDFRQTIDLADELGRKAAPSKCVETLFSVYGRAIFQPEEDMQKIANGLPNVREVTDLFIAWSMTKDLPTDILPVIGYELLQLVAGGVPGVKSKTGQRQPRMAVNAGSVLSMLKTPSDAAIREGALPEIVETADDVAAFLNTPPPVTIAAPKVRLDAGNPEDPM